MESENPSCGNFQQSMVCKLEASDSDVPVDSTDRVQSGSPESSQNGCSQTTIKKEDIDAQDDDVPFSEMSNLHTPSEEAGLMVNPNSSDNSTTASDMDTLVTFVKEFKQCRLKRGFTQADVALSFAMADGYTVSQSTICRFEAMQLSLKSMHKLKLYMKQWLQEPSVPNSDKSTVGRRRKKRTTIKDNLKSVLENHFLQDQKPSTSDMSVLADTLDLDREVVRIWFCNRRQKEKRLCKTETQ